MFGAGLLRLALRLPPLDGGAAAVVPAAPTPELLAAADSLEAIAVHQLHTKHCTAGAACALCVLSKRIQAALSPTAQTVQVPQEVLSSMQHFARGLSRGRQEDAHEMLRLTIEALHHASLRSMGLPTHGPRAAPGARERTVSERIFGGTLRSSVTCQACGGVSNTDDPFDDLSLELAGAASVAAALTAFTRTERLDDANRYKCSVCGQLSAAAKRIAVARAPNMLVLHLKRFSAMGGKITRGIAFEERLALRNHACDADAAAAVYALQAVVVHSGFSVSCGHYYAYARDARGAWHQFDDSCVSTVSLSRVLADATGAYVLFYHRLPAQQAQLPPLPSPLSPLPRPAPPSALPAPSLPSLPSLPVPVQPRAFIGPQPPPARATEPRAARLKRKRDAMHEARRAAEARLTASGAPAGAHAQVLAALRESPWPARVREQLRDVKRTAPPGADASQLVRDWRARGLERTAREAAATLAPQACQLVVSCARSALQTELTLAADHAAENAPMNVE